jgi:CheY-like chemotaxis protein
LEAEKKAITASQAKTIFLASMSHELRTPLTAILGFAQLMERSKKRDPEDQEYLNVITSSGEHLLGLINDVLSISKIEAGKVSLQEQAFHLPNLLKTLEEMLQIRAKNKLIDLVFNINNQIPEYVLGDEGKLRQILINLLGNAIKFTSKGTVTLSIYWQNDTAYFEIKDTGYGISPEDQEKLFHNFVQTESGQKLGEGTGLGLAISKQFIELMQGSIKVSSQLGLGTTFNFNVKLLLSKKVNKETSSSKVIALAPKQSSYRILVADDKWEERTLLTTLLSSVGFDLRQATNGKEALEIWMNWQPHLIYLDLNMPIIDGYLTTKIIRDLEVGKAIDNIVGLDFSQLKIKNPHTLIIVITASVLDYERNSILDVGCDDLIAKPYKENTIFNKLKEHLAINYVYEEIKTVDKELAKDTKDTIDIKDKLLAIPKDLLSKLGESVALGDIYESMETIEEIHSYDEDLANRLKGLLKSYRFDELLSILKPYK